MSDYEYIKGILKPTNKTVDEYIGDIKLPSYCDTKEEYFNDEFYRKACAINGLVYEIESNKLDPSDAVYIASSNEDGSINFEVRYYNGGCSFSEALEEALKNVAPQR
jgi:hypothetical protein